MSQPTTEVPAFHGYLTLLKAMNVEALKAVFAGDYPTQDFRDLHISIEYPIEAAHYPGIWVDYADTDKLRIAGVDHTEYTAVVGTVANTQAKHTRWRFAGYVSYTVTALSSWERDRLYDELVRIFSFRGTPYHERFKSHIETNDFIGANMDFDEIEPQGNAAAPGTPWGTDEIIYERTINMQILGEFVTDPDTGVLYPLSAILVEPTVALGGSPIPAPSASQWH